MHARVIPLMPAAEAATPTGSDAAPGLVAAVLQEVARELETLAREPAHLHIIDLHSLPLDEHTTAVLRAALGRGEVVVRIRSAALTIVEETGYPGVWWQSQGACVEERDELPAQGRLDLIVVATVPPLVGAAHEDVAEAAARLRDAAAVPTFVNAGDPPATGEAHE